MPPTRRNLHSQGQQPPVKKASTRAPEPVVLGLDVGTTATRASLAPFRLKGTLKYSQHRERLETGDIPSAANLFAVDKSPESCIGYIGDNPDQTPVKMFLYIVRVYMLRKRGDRKDLGHVKKFRQRIPQLEHFFKRYDNLDEDMQHRVMAHAQCIFLAHLGQVRCLSEELAESQNVSITKLAATIPSNWDSWTQQHYVRLLLRAWDNLTNEDITILHESEAIGHRILRLDENTRAAKPERLILVDFGGHTLSHTTFEIQYCNDPNKFSFFKVTRDNCIHGGSELHASLVKDRIRKDIAGGKICVEEKDEPYVYESLMTDYRNNYRSKIDGKQFRLKGWKDPEKRGGSVTVIFNGKESLKHYRDSFIRPLAEMDTLFENAARSSPNTAVVLSGGTFSNIHVLEQAERMIVAAGLRLLPWTDSVAVEGRISSSVAVGAALALVNSLSVEQFMSRAAIAVQVKPTKEADIPVIWSEGGPREASITVRGGRQVTDVVIACCPLPPHDGLSVRFENTFELQSLSEKLCGKYTMSLDYKRRDDGKGIPDQLILTVAKHGSRNSSWVETVEWPVYYDAGACVCFVDFEKYEKLTSSGQGVPQQAPRGRRNQKGTPRASHRIWEQIQRDEGRSYWEGFKTPIPPTPTLEEFEVDIITQHNNASAIDDLESDLEPVHGITRGKFTKITRPQLSKTSTCNFSGRRKTKLATRAARKQHNRSQMGKPIAGLCNAAHQKAACGQNVTDLGVVPDYMECSSAPMETTTKDCKSRTRHTFASRTRSRQSIDLLPRLSRHARHVSRCGLIASDGLSQPGMNRDEGTGVSQSRNATGDQTYTHASSDHLMGSSAYPIQLYPNTSYHGMSTQNQADTPRHSPDFVPGALSGDRHELHPAAGEYGLADPMCNSQETKCDENEQIPSQINIQDIYGCP